MNLCLALAALVVGGVIGTIVGWRLRGATARWCCQCGRMADTLCAECRSRSRAAGSRNQRSGLLADAS